MIASNYLRIVDSKSDCIGFPAENELAFNFSFKLDPFQKHAIKAIHNNENILVTCRTGSGKTVCAEYQIAHSLKKGKRVFYTTPIKSLSNQKFHDLKEMYPGRVGILTGDIKFQPDASIVVMTTEILRNLLYKKGSSTENVGLTAGMSMDGLDAVVFDEVHYINNKERGKVWEETLILLPREINLVLLSATIAGPEAFASWLGDLKQKPIHLISTTYRIVPLTHYIIDTDNTLRPVMDEKERFIDTTYRVWLMNREKTVDDHADHKRRVAGREAGQVIGAQQGKVKLKSFTYQLNACVQMLYAKELLPALFFVFSRKDCEVYASQIEGSLVDTSDGAAIENIFDFHLSRYKDQMVTSPQYHTLRSLLVRGIAFHHSGLQPLLKEIIEILFGKGLVRVMFCTETFAVGINMPTKTVVFLEYKKYCDQAQGLRMLATDEYIQMAGRAGRRGKDKLGTVIYLPRREPASLEEVRKMMTGGSVRISSRMDFGYDFILKTLQSGSVDWKNVLHESYWYKQQLESRKLVEEEHKTLLSKMAALSLTENDVKDVCAFIEKKKMLEFVVNDARKRLQSDIGTWMNRHMGPKWKRVLDEYPSLSVKLRVIEQEMADYGEGYEDRLIAPYIEFLRGIGFICDGVEMNLTQKGVAASEINEAHPILLTASYFNGYLDGLTSDDLVGFLSAFVGDAKDAEKSPSMRQLRVSDDLRNSLSELSSLTESMWSAEKAANIAFTDYWDISTFWIEIGLAWLRGDPVGAICSNYEIYEGNLYKFIMSLNNMIEELVSVATLCSDVGMLERLAAVKNSVGRTGAMAFGESLYLRI